MARQYAHRREGHDDRYGIALFVNNFFNKVYVTTGGSAVSTGTSNIWGDPRIIGGEVSVKF